MTDTENMIPSAPSDKPDHDDDFDLRSFTWDHPGVVVQAVAATAVYVDEYDNVVIRQQGAWDEEHDHLIILPRREAEKVAAAIFDATVALWPSNRNRRPSDPAADHPGKSQDTTAAERQRRYRERKRVNNGQPQTETDESGQSQYAEAAQ